MRYRPAPPRSVASRITAILSTFLAGESHSVTEIARLTRLPVSTTHRLTAELVSWQLLRRTADGRYEVGLTLQRLGGDGWSVPALHERGPQVVTDLCEVAHRRARLGSLRGDRVAYIEKQTGTGAATAFCANAVLPAHATALGKALLAFAPRETVASVEQRLTAYTRHTLTTPDKLHRALQAIRLTRTAEARGELFPGDWAVAVPVFGGGGVVVAALELDVHDLCTDIESCRVALAVAARGLSRELAVDVHRVGHPHLRLLPRPDMPGSGAVGPRLGSDVTVVPDRGERNMYAQHRLKGCDRVSQKT
jgi:DNA-binding IclR family transcriptional regulator